MKSLARRTIRFDDFKRIPGREDRAETFYLFGPDALIINQKYYTLPKDGLSQQVWVGHVFPFKNNTFQHGYCLYSRDNYIDKKMTYEEIIAYHRQSSSYGTSNCDFLADYQFNLNHIYNASYIFSEKIRY